MFEGAGPKTLGRTNRGMEGASGASLLALATMLLPACGLVPDATVSADKEFITSERGGAVTLTLQLESRPFEALELSASVSDGTEAEVSGPLHVAPHSWRDAVSVRVTGRDDAERDGDQPFTVTLYARAMGSSRQHARRLAVLHFINRDDESGLLDGLGDLAGGDVASHATAVSSDGKVIAGWSASATGEQALRWTDTDGLIGLGGPQGRAQAVSPDGTLIAGSVAHVQHEVARSAAFWRGTGPYELAAPMAGVPGGPPLFLFVAADVILDDGTMFGTCIQYRAYGQPLGCRWRAPAQIDLMGLSYVYAADDAGHYAGSLLPDRHAPYYAQAIFDGRGLGYADGFVCGPLAGCVAEARAFSLTDGATVVGTAQLPASGTPATGTPPLYPTAFVYTESEGSVRLADLPGGEENSGAYAVVRGGALIGGFGSDERGKQAVLWLDRAPVALEDMLADTGRPIPDGWTLEEVRALSADGRVVVGTGINPEGHDEAFRVVLPAP